MSIINRTVSDMTPDTESGGTHVTVYRRAILKAVNNPPYQYQAIATTITAKHFTRNGQDVLRGEIKTTVIPVNDPGYADSKNHAILIPFDELEDMWAEYQAWKAEVLMSVDETSVTE